MFAHARDITKREPRDHQREGPLHFCAVVAEPEQAKCDHRRRDHCANRQPGYMSLVGNPAPRFATIIHARRNPQSTVAAGVSPATIPPPTRPPLPRQPIVLASPTQCSPPPPQ